jgi:HSP20 family protein
MNNSLMNWDPFRELDDIAGRMSQLMGRSPSVWSSLPATDIFEENGKLVVETALPNFKEDEVDAQVTHDRLVIKADHKAEEEKKERNYLRRESSQASYYRAIALPQDIDADSADARFENGLLRVTFDRRELPQPKRLALKGKGEKAEK